MVAVMMVVAICAINAAPNRPPRAMQQSVLTDAEKGRCYRIAASSSDPLRRDYMRNVLSNTEIRMMRAAGIDETLDWVNIGCAKFLGIPRPEGPLALAVRVAYSDSAMAAHDRWCDTSTNMDIHGNCMLYRGISLAPPTGMTP